MHRWPWTLARIEDHCSIVLTDAIIKCLRSDHLREGSGAFIINISESLLDCAVMVLPVVDRNASLLVTSLDHPRVRFTNYTCSASSPCFRNFVNGSGLMLAPRMMFLSAWYEVVERLKTWFYIGDSILSEP